MSRGGTQTSTTTSAPPSFIQPYLRDAAAGASSQWQMGNLMSQDQLAANQMVRERAAGGSPLINSANNYVNTSLNGGFMGQNPYLESTFNRAAGAVTNQVQSNFARSGRDPRGIDAAGFAQEGYNDLASQIYGGAYDADRNRQQASLLYAQPLANQSYQDAAQLGEVGRMTNPGTALDDYIARLNNLSGGYGVTTNQQPTQRNALAGALGGASAGAMLGPWGMLGGAVLGGLYGG